MAGRNSSILILISLYLHSSSFVLGSVSNTELSAFVTGIWNDDTNGASFSDITYNLQSHTSSSSSADLANNRLFHYVNENHLFTKPTYSAFIALLDNFDKNTAHSEHTSSTETAEIDRFITEVMKTSVMSETYRFLHGKGYTTSTTAFRDTLKSIWFTQYSRSGTSHGSNGFEHVFVGETTSTDVSGFHNWIQFYLEEKLGHINYLGYIYSNQPRKLGVHFTWYNKPKPLTTLLVGTSPEFDLAVLTTCFLVRKNTNCHFDMAGNYLTVKSYDVSYVHGDQVATAYFN
ncbi:Poly(U)-specific endoribonuclease [Mizuhopecten yessoensis]|uniref:Uridylate-specific endoribonuclease n=2 Tax=Mizuhopecten yessoensis TaxID=6573 RepID=A0A210QMV3_MIZYE|nr:Poly(U)-specific endoribonuclease [Mizuhopecten yessoensis]